MPKRAKIILAIDLLLFLIAGYLYLGLFFKKTNKKIVYFQEQNKAEIILPKNKIKKPIKIIFVGDIMLGRWVDKLMQKYGSNYPFEKISSFLKQADFTIGNLEGPIVKKVPKLDIHSLKFAFKKESAQILAKAGFKIVSLANNHTFNMGQAGLEQTKNFLSQTKISFFGDPIRCKNTFLKKDNLIFYGVNKTFSFNCSDKEIASSIKEIKAKNKKSFLAVFIHWGKEYQSKSSFSQKNLAYQMIDAGADLIIGSHPHVVQEVELYKNKLIFYSLGNFIFDQYFSETTQKELAVKLIIKKDKAVYQLMPIKSKSSQPFLMVDKERENFLNDLALKSSKSLFFQIKKGEITLNK